jgi:hypothetical protein
MLRARTYRAGGCASSSLSPRERAGGEGLGSLAHPSAALTLTLSQREGGTLNCAPSAVADAGNGPYGPPPTQSRKRGYEGIAKKVSCFCTREDRDA